MRTFSLAGLLAALAGCADAGPKYAPVSGRVTLNGEPLAGVSVDFQPVAAGKDADPGPGSTGKTDKDGRFTLRSPPPATGRWSAGTKSGCGLRRRPTGPTPRPAGRRGRRRPRRSPGGTTSSRS